MGEVACVGEEAKRRPVFRRRVLPPALPRIPGIRRIFRAAQYAARARMVVPSMTGRAVRDVSEGKRQVFMKGG